ncbi:MAG: radical SAM protein [Chloroflexi bacterium]|nr:radical SAM protein [Chloroflexota bacterium]MBU1750532.1 radical SAM protein [Chloroflexota bacterium]
MTPLPLGDGLRRAWATRDLEFPRRLLVARPRRTVPVSLTGPACALDCAHCGRHYLAHMIPIAQAVADPRVRQAPSLLISGGCDPAGRVPVREHLPAVQALAPGKRLNWHVGLIAEADVAAIAPLVDTVSLDFVGDEATIREVYGLPAVPADYVATYRRLWAAGLRVVPHLTIGLRGGLLGHERPALDALAGLDPAALVFLVFIPTPGTRYADRTPPPVADVTALLAEARLRLPHTPLLLGCMRPGGHYRAQLDPLAVQAGVNGIVNPAPAARRLAVSLGLDLVPGDECCALVIAEQRQ